MKKIVFTFLLMLSISSTYSQWVANYGFSSGDINFTNAKGTAVTTDALGYSYVTGYTFDPATQNDIIVIKYTPTGDTVWVRSYNGNGNGNDEGKGICVDAAGNVYVVGFAEISSKSCDVMLLKYSPSGVELWAEPYRGSESATMDQGFGIAVDLIGNIYITGYTTNSEGNNDIFTAKCNSLGASQWSRVYNGSGNSEDQGLSIAVSAAGNVYVAGYETNSDLNTDIAVIRYSNSGDQDWVRIINGNGGEDKAWGIVVDAAENVYITGYTTVSGNNTNYYTAKLSGSNDLLWESSFGGNETDKAWGIVVDTDGSAYVTGEYTDANHNVNYMTLRYSGSNGAQVWAAPYDGPAQGDDRASSIGILVNLDLTRSIIVTGKSWGTAQNYDYATVKYNAASGAFLTASRYSYSGNTNDLAKDLAISPTKKIIVTGFSQLIIGDYGVEHSYLSTQSIDWGSELSAINNAPKNYTLEQNYPNPFNPSTNIKFNLSASGTVKLVVYDMLGKVVDILVNQNLEAGTYNINYANKSLASGIYFYELSTADGFRDIKKMTLVK